MKVVFCFCLGLLLLSHGANAADYKNEYKLSVVPGATSGWGKTATYFADLVRKIRWPHQYQGVSVKPAPFRQADFRIFDAAQRRN